MQVTTNNFDTNFHNITDIQGVVETLKINIRETRSLDWSAELLNVLITVTCTDQDKSVTASSDDSHWAAIQEVIRLAESAQHALYLPWDMDEMIVNIMSADI